MLNQALVSLPLKTVVGFGAPVGKMSLQVGKKWGSVVGSWVVVHVNLVERRGAANSGPLVEVPWRRIRVLVCGVGGVGRIIYGSG